MHLALSFHSGIYIKFFNYYMSQKKKYPQKNLKEIILIIQCSKVFQIDILENTSVIMWQ